jgi:nitroimidazol reductase NimA-like FMN-containing flavoprotein (pyridoxamine 5'-phosphate oxidase superfamily)
MSNLQTTHSNSIPQRYLDYFSNKIDPKFCRVATVDSKNRPFVAAFRFAYDDKHIIFCSFSNRYTARNIELNPNVSIIVDRNDEHPTSYCTMRGRARILRKESEFDPWLSLAKKTNPRLDEIRERAAKGDYNLGGGFLVVKVEVQEIFSRMI